jgi:hypothetical protein
MGVPTTEFVPVSITETSFERRLVIYARTWICALQVSAAQKQATIATANSGTTLFDPWRPRLPLLADLEIVEEKTHGLGAFMGLIYYSKVSIGMK